MGLLSNEHGALFLIFNLFDVLSETIAVLNLIYVYFPILHLGHKAWPISEHLPVSICL